MARKKKKRPLNAVGLAAGLTAGAVAGGAGQTAASAFMPGVRVIPPFLLPAAGTIGGAGLVLSELDRLNRKRRKRRK